MNTMVRRAIALTLMTSASVFGIGAFDGAAWAQEAPAAEEQSDGVDASDILVIGRGYESGFAGEKALASIRATPSSVTIIDSERIEKQRLITLDDVLKQTAGVTVVRNVSTYPQFYARGFQISSFLFDGTPQQGFAQAPYSMPDLFLFDHVEFLRGPSALFSGSGSPGGSVNLVRKRPKQEFSLTSSFSAGSWNFLRAEVDISSPLNKDGTIRARAGGMVQDAGEFIDNYRKDRKLGFLSVDIDLGAKTTFSVGGYYDDYSTTIQTGLPADATNGLLDLPRNTYLGSDDNKVRTKQAQLYAQINHEFSSRWKARATVQYNDLKRDEFYGFVRGPVNSVNQGVLNLELYRGKHKADAVSGDASIVGEFDLFGNTSGIIIGGDYQRSHWSFASNYANPGPPLTVDIFNPRPVVMPAFPLGPTGADFYEGAETKEQYGFYGQTRLKILPSLTLVGGGRIGWVTYTAQDFDLTPNGIYKVKGKISPYAGIVYDFADKWTLYGSYADVFEPQSAFDRNQNPLGPVSGTQFEAGIKTNLFSDRFLLTAAIYRIRQSNRAVTDPTDINASIASGLVEGKGFEIELNGHITKNWSISGGYNYNVNKILSDTNPALVGTQIAPVTPKHSVKLYTDYSFAEGSTLAGLSIGGSFTLNGKQRGTGVEQPGYFVADLHAGYDISERFSVSLNVNNIFDKKYYSEIRDTRFSNWYGAPRSAFVAFKIKY